MKRMADYYLKGNINEIHLTEKFSGNDKTVLSKKGELLKEKQMPSSSIDNPKEDEYVTATYWG